MSNNPVIAFDCGECMGSPFKHGPNIGGMVRCDPCPQCHGLGNIRLTLDDLAERIAGKIADKLFRDSTVISDPYYTPPDEQRPVLPEPV